MNVVLQYLLPQHILSRMVAWVISIRWKWFKNFLILWFVKRYGVDTSISEKKIPEEYETFNEFFTRKLKPSCRPIDASPQAIISPVDGVVSQMGTIEGETIFQAKNKNYSLQALLANDSQAEYFRGGSFATFYLSPKDYHRIHIPVTGELLKMAYVPGSLFAVNPLTTERISRVFAKNERVVNFFRTDFGMMAVVMVGAMIVASISTVWAGKVMPNQKKSVQTWDYETEHKRYQQGSEMGYFELGSTVILLFEAERVSWNAELKEKSPVKMGEKIGMRKGEYA